MTEQCRRGHTLGPDGRRPKDKRGYRKCRQCAREDYLKRRSDPEKHAHDLALNRVRTKLWAGKAA